MEILQVAAVGPAPMWVVVRSVVGGHTWLIVWTLPADAARTIWFFRHKHTTAELVDGVD